MAITLPIKDMTTKEKIQAMEIIWEDLCKKADSLSSPAWHQQVLQAREKQIKSNKDEFADWEIAKMNIRKTVR